MWDLQTLARLNQEHEDRLNNTRKEIEEAYERTRSSRRAEAESDHDSTVGVAAD
jgi:hypothetical protein